MKRLFELGMVLSILTVFGCQLSSGGSTSVTSGGQQDSAPRVNTKKLKELENLSDPVVTNLERSRWGNPDTYTELGKQYHLLKTNDGYTEMGTASWYGAKFHGRRTSSGHRRMLRMGTLFCFNSSMIRVLTSEDSRDFAPQL